jgi:hypothetical protein
MHAYIHTYIYACVHAHACIGIHICTYVYLNTHTDIQIIDARIYTCAYACIRIICPYDVIKFDTQQACFPWDTHADTYVLKHIHTYKHIHEHAYIHMCIYIHTYMHTYILYIYTVQTTCTYTHRQARTHHTCA